MNEAFLIQIQPLLNKDERYRPEAYAFVMEALSFTQSRFNREHHVSGEELLAGVQELALRQFGALAPKVFEHWGVYEPEDFGYIVFNLVDAQILRRRDEDSFESFRQEIDFKATFHRGWRRQLDRAVRRIR